MSKEDEITLHYLLHASLGYCRVSLLAGHFQKTVDHLPRLPKRCGNGLEVGVDGYLAGVGKKSGDVLANLMHLRNLLKK